MAWTSHGHHVPGTAHSGVFRGPVAKCGGPALCEPCSVEAEQISEEIKEQADDERRKLENPDPEILPVFSPKFFSKDPEITGCVFGDELVEGMIVQVEDPEYRLDLELITPNMRSYGQAIFDAEENNRWCVVTRLHVEGKNLRFIGVYDDGTMRARQFKTEDAWYVKGTLRTATGLTAAQKLGIADILDEDQK